MLRRSVGRKEGEYWTTQLSQVSSNFDPFDPNPVLSNRLKLVFYSFQYDGI
jgi:hypothetical protein